MAGRHVGDAPLISKGDEPSELDSFVAAYAGIRRRSTGISPQKIIDHGLPKEATLIDDLIRNLQTLRHIFGNTNFAAAALLPLFRGGNLLALMLPDLQCDAADPGALTDQER